MLLFLTMVIDQEKLECCNTDVSTVNMVFQEFCNNNYQITDTGEDGNLEKVQFGRIINGTLLYDNGESDSTVFKGLNLLFAISLNFLQLH